MTTTTISVTVSTEHADAVRDGLVTVLTTLNLPTHGMETVTHTGPASDADLVAEALRELNDQEIGDATTIARLEFDVEEWDNGYFYTDNPTVVWREGVTPLVAEPSLDMTAIAESLYEMNGDTLGRYSEAAVIDFTTGTITT